MIKRFVAIFLLFPALALADARIELNAGGAYHAPWSATNADLEHKGLLNPTDVISTQHADGTYTAWLETRIPEVSRLTVDAPLAFDNEGVSKHVSDCNTTAGTFQDDDGNAYTTNNCVVIVQYTRTRRDFRYDVHIIIRLDRAAASASAASEMAGTSVGYRY